GVWQLSVHAQNSTPATTGCTKRTPPLFDVGRGGNPAILGFRGPSTAREGGVRFAHPALRSGSEQPGAIEVLERAQGIPEQGHPALARLAAFPLGVGNEKIPDR